MATTILEALENAEYNIKGNNILQLELARNQLHNAVVLLEKGYKLGDLIEPLLEKYVTVESVPDK